MRPAVCSPQPPAGQTAGASSRERIAVLLLAAAFVLLCVHGLLWDTPTVDEFAHLPAGYYYLQTGSFELFSLNPPLVKLLTAAPLLLLRPAIDTGAEIRHTGWYPWVFGTDFMERNRGNYDGIFFFGRLPVVLLGLLGGLLVRRWARELYGPTAGIVALGLYALCPSIVAHAHLATVDVGAMALLVLALYLFDRWLREPGAGRLAAAGAALGLAELAKFTSLLLYPVLLVLAAWALAEGRPLPLRTGRRAGVTASLGSLLLLFLLSAAVVDLGYLFQGVGRPLGELRLESRSIGALARALPRLPAPLPSPYLEGLDGLQLVNEQGEYPGYLFGEWSREGWKGYYLVALLFKTPLPLLLLALAAPFLPRARRPGERSLWLPLLLLLVAFSLLSRVDYGIRYVLPVVPLACIYAGRLVPWALARGRAVRTAGLALLVLYPVSVLAATPDTLSYFNLLDRIRGGRDDEILLDSNLDWGQGLKRLAADVKRNDLPGIDLAYFGHVDPALYGIVWRFPDPNRPGLVAVSANFLHGYPYVTYAHGRMVPVPPDAFTWIAAYPRVADLGGGIYLYRIGPVPPPPAEGP